MISGISKELFDTQNQWIYNSSANFVNVALSAMVFAAATATAGQLKTSHPRSSESAISIKYNVKQFSVLGHDRLLQNTFEKRLIFLNKHILPVLAEISTTRFVLQDSVASAMSQG